jgi:hypothetical protein
VTTLVVKRLVKGLMVIHAVLQLKQPSVMEFELLLKVLYRHLTKRVAL